jgi:glutamate/tyrosine decarboxylase-like PLP-dependent enzyme
LIALVVARDGISYADRTRAVLYVSEQRHGSMDQAAKIVGLRPDQIRPIAVDERFRLNVHDLRSQIALDRSAGRMPWAVTANGGATNTGAVDPLADISKVCREFGLWLHVDAAYGWPAVLSDHEKPEFRGIEQADSVTLDPHKWFAQTFEAGCILVRDGKLLPRTFTNHPDYLQDVLPADDEVNFADYGIALTRRFRALKIWLSVKALGLGWYRNLIVRNCRMAEFAQALLEKTSEFEILCPRHLSIVCFRYVPSGPARTDHELNALNQALVEALLKTGKAFLSSTRLNGRVALRFCFVNWRTTAEDVEMVINLLRGLVKTL